MKTSEQIAFAAIFALSTSFCFPQVNPNLGGGGVILHPCWFSLNYSETVKAVTLAFCIIQ